VTSKFQTAAQVQKATKVPDRVTVRAYHPELDVLRCFGFLLVFCHHSLPHDPKFYTDMGVGSFFAKLIAGWGAMGAMGVDLFFLLSAYLVTNSFLIERERTRSIDTRAFYVRRALRIWPLYVLFLAFAWSMQWWIPGQHIGWRAGLAFLFMVGNWWVVFVGFPSSVIFPLWAVSVEEQFYLVWPWLMRRLTRRGIAIAAAVMLAIGNIARLYLSMHHTWESKLWTNTLVRIDPIAAGVLLALALGGVAPRIAIGRRIVLFIAGVAGFWLAANYWVIKGDPLTVPRVMIGYPVMTIGACAMLLGVLTDVKPFAPGPLAYLGRISYGLYVYHVVGLLTSDYWVQHQTSSFGRYLWRVLVALAVTIVISAISYQLIEKPFLRLKERFGRAAHA
jgi:peptidoglycan/LPS O-acetylase OafA/YrhL